VLLPVSQNFTLLVSTLALIGCYVAFCYCLTYALNTLPIAVVYATWSGLGIFSSLGSDTYSLSRHLIGEPFWACYSSWRGWCW